MKQNLVNSIIIYLIFIYMLISINPINMYDNDGITLKKWNSINLSDVNTLHNVYIYCVLLGILSYYIGNEI